MQLSRVGTMFVVLAHGGVIAIIGIALASCTAVTDSKDGVKSSARIVSSRPVPNEGGVNHVGKPYVIAGQTYVPQEAMNYRAEGHASWYGSDFHGRRTANGEVYDMNSLSAAHPTLPLPCFVRITNLENQRSIVVRINDRGPYHDNRVIDVSALAAKILGFYDKGVARVRVEYVGKGSRNRSDHNTKLAGTLRTNEPVSPLVRVTTPAPLPKVPPMPSGL